MLRHYKIFDHGKNKAHIINQNALKTLQALGQNIQVLGECDEGGNMLEEIKKNNFLSDDEVKKPKSFVELNHLDEKSNKKTSYKKLKEDEIDDVLKGVKVDKYGDPEQNIEPKHDPAKLKLKKKNDKIADEYYKKNKAELLKNVVNDPIK